MSLKKIWDNKNKILEGLKNKMFKSEIVETIAAERMSICNDCPFINRSGDLCIMIGTQPCCGKCGCSLSLKTRSLSSGCGDEENPRWNAVLTEEEEDNLD